MQDRYIKSQGANLIATLALLLVMFIAQIWIFEMVVLCAFGCESPGSSLKIPAAFSRKIHLCHLKVSNFFFPSGFGFG